MRSLFLKRGRTSSVLSSPELKNPERELYYFRRRLTIAAALIVLVFAGLLGRFVDLQVRPWPRATASPSFPSFPIAA
jgi:hypothetical protein